MHTLLRQTDRQTSCDGNTALCVASRGKTDDLEKSEKKQLSNMRRQLGSWEFTGKKLFTTTL